MSYVSARAQALTSEFIVFSLSHLSTCSSKMTDKILGNWKVADQIERKILLDLHRCQIKNCTSNRLFGRKYFFLGTETAYLSHVIGP